MKRTSKVKTAKHNLEWARSKLCLIVWFLLVHPVDISQ